MKLKIIILILGLVLIAGCSSQFQDCARACIRINQDDYAYESKCQTIVSAVAELVNENISDDLKYYPCTQHYDNLSDYCFNECKPK